MTDPALPAWEGDALSTFLSEAQWNERVSALKLTDVYSLLRRVHDALREVTTITEKENNPNLLPSRFLMARAHAAWLAAVRMGLSGQTVESYPLVRAVVENSWYALHLAKDPNPPTRATVWLCRDDDAAAKARCRTEFTIANVRGTHAALDTAAATALQTLYEWTIDFGAHPNERGVLAAMIRTDPSQRGSFGAVFLTNNPTLIVAPLKMTIETAVGALKTFRWIFPRAVLDHGRRRRDREAGRRTQLGLRAVRPRSKDARQRAMTPTSLAAAGGLDAHPDRRDSDHRQDDFLAFVGRRPPDDDRGPARTRLRCSHGSFPLQPLHSLPGARSITALS